MSVAQKVFLGCCMIAAACLCFYLLTGADQPDSAELTPMSARQSDGTTPLPRPDAKSQAMADSSDVMAQGKLRCADTALSNPYGRGSSNCLNDPEPLVPAADGDAKILRAKLDLVWPCQGIQQPDAASSDCSKINADAAGLVRQLETLAERGDSQASTDLSNLVQSRKKTATGEYLEALNHAEARISRR
ncbi:hypothetical protein GN109_17225 [Collimonas pratensis]|uniref:hypothetical protein n=1 Tax=Collimonas pratensis TaxID=279113 RepID=UPI00143DC901|nr:hypothetical protein [Collimonas pratensis]NKI71170.1 hypothetical protein [Collimonas pratensis]